MHPPLGAPFGLLKYASEEVEMVEEEKEDDDDCNFIVDERGGEREREREE